jgi:hypothetical protein
MQDHNSSAFDALGEQLSRRLAAGFSRRSFFGSLGKASVALAGAGTGILIDADQVQAAYCGHTSSTSCNNLTGSNSCPANTCGCGYWKLCDQQACANAKVWSDCCAQYSCSCRCTSDGWPTCCFTKEWAQGCGSSSSRIVCRRWYCSTGC